MVGFEGYLLLNDNGATIDRYIQFDTYSSSPNQREEILAIRDDNTRDLFRVTAEGTKTALVFDTKAVDLEGKIAIQDFFRNAMVDELQRKVKLTYWNDEDNVYKTTYFYIPDIKFKIKRITKDNIFYRPLTIDLIEY